MGKKSENEILSDNAEQGMTFPVELNHGDFFVSVETTDDFPTDASVYAVYTNPLDGIVYRKKVSQDTQNYLKNTSVQNHIMQSHQLNLKYVRVEISCRKYRFLFIIKII